MNIDAILSALTSRLALVLHFDLLLLHFIFHFATIMIPPKYTKQMPSFTPQYFCFASTSATCQIYLNTLTKFLDTYQVLEIEILISS